jgi:hypothetical protein
VIKLPIADSVPRRQLELMIYQATHAAQYGLWLLCSWEPGG